MAETRKTSPDQGDQYQITVQGILDGSWAEWLGNLTLITARDDTNGPMTLIRGSFDQAALRGVLVKLCDLNLVLIEIRRIDP